MTQWTIRPYQRSDAAALGALMHNAIRAGAAGAYDAEQRAAWSPAPRSGPAFDERISGQICMVAEDEGGAAGFMTLTEDGLLDLAFVRPDRMGAGLAGALHDRLLVEARRLQLSALRVEASHIARRFFAKRGWRYERTQTLERHGVTIENHIMTYRLSP